MWNWYSLLSWFIDMDYRYELLVWFLNMSSNLSLKVNDGIGNMSSSSTTTNNDTIEF